MKDLAIVFDFDDTLVHTRINYVNSIKWVNTKYLPKLSFKHFLEGFEKSMEENLNHLLDSETKNDIHPFHPLIFIKNFYKFLDKNSVSYDKKLIEKKVLSFLADVQIRGDSLKVLNKLEKFELYLITVGDEKWQKSRIHKTGFEQFFNKMFFVIEKDDVLKGLKKEYKTVIMIGDSLKSDILAANNSGAIAIHLTGGDTWSYRHSDDAKPDHVIDNLDEVVEIVNKYSFKPLTT